MSQLNVLVSGAGIAGIVVAYWLGKAGINVTVIERTPSLRMSGQGIDIRGIGIDIVRQMGVEEEIRAHTTKEAGMTFVDEKDFNLATLNIDGSSSFTAEIEIIRADLVKILYKAAESTGHVKYEFDVTATDFSQDSSGVTVTLSNGSTRTYDLVVAADGFGSRLRKLMLGPELSKASVKSLDAFTAFFTVPSQKQDYPLGRWYMTTGSRATMLRPKTPSSTSVYLTCFSDTAAIRDLQSSGDMDAQKRFLTDKFADVSWELPRVLAGMQQAGVDDFYFQEVGQIKLDPASWHQGRCVLVGDAAYCPSPFTGMGTTLAVVGAYVLAGEIVKEVHRTSVVTGEGRDEAEPERDFTTAFGNYETLMGPYVKDVQYLPLNGAIVRLLNPASAWALWLLRTVLWVVDRLGLLKSQSLLGEIKSAGITLPEYRFE